MKKRSANGIGTRGDTLPPDQARVRNQFPTQAERYLRKPATLDNLPGAEPLRETGKVIKRTKRRKG